MRKVLIGMVTIVMIFAVANIYACPDHDKAKGQADAAKASMNSDNSGCPYSGTAVKAAVANGTDKVQATQLNSKTNKKAFAKTAIHPANYKPATTNDNTKDKKSANPATQNDMAAASQNH